MPAHACSIIEEENKYAQEKGSIIEESL